MGVLRVWPPTGAAVSDLPEQRAAPVLFHPPRSSSRHTGAQWPPTRCWPVPLILVPGHHDVLAGANDGGHLVEESRWFSRATALVAARGQAKSSSGRSG
eukprot:scaffold83154_cov64-Phaeocystis_antarctica.AAC.8